MEPIGLRLSNTPYIRYILVDYAKLLKLYRNDNLNVLMQKTILESDVSHQINKLQYCLPKKRSPQFLLKFDYYAYNQTDIFSKIKNYFKTSNAMFDLRNNIQKFDEKEFEKNIISDYNKIIKYYQSKNHRDIYDHITAEMF